MLDVLKKLWKPKPPPIVQSRRRINIPGDRVENIFAIGDIHGRLDLLLDAEARIAENMAGSALPALILYLGDYIDRGPDSKGVIAHLSIKLAPPLYRICISGNHDDAFLRFLKKDRYNSAWLDFGGDKTLLSYGIDANYFLRMDPSGAELKIAIEEAVPTEHVGFLESLPVAVTIGQYLFVHAGIVPGVPLSEQSDSDLMWIREPFLSQGPKLDCIVVHGHTPSTSFQYGEKRIGIDTGAYATGKLGVLHIHPGGIAEI